MADTARDLSDAAPRPAAAAFRRRGTLLTLTAAWPLLTLANRFPMPFTSDDARSAPPAWATEGAVALRFDPTQVVGTRPSPSRPWEPHVHYPVDMPVYLTGVPKGWAAELVRLNSRLTFADGSTMDVRADSHGQLPEAPGRRGRARYAAWEALDEREFPFARALAMRLADQPLDERAALTWLGRDNDWDRLASAPAFDAEAFLSVWRHRVAGTVTLDRGGVQMDGAALEIFAIPWKEGSLVLLTRETVVSPLLQPTTTPEYDVLLTATLASPLSEIYEPFARGTLAHTLGGLELARRIVPVGVEPQRTTWRVEWFTRAQLEAARCVRPGPLQLTILETRFAGLFSRRIHADRLQITFDADTASAAIHAPLH